MNHIMVYNFQIKNLNYLFIFQNNKSKVTNNEKSNILPIIHSRMTINICFVSKRFQDWNRESTPLKAKGKEAKFPSKPLDKFSGTEKDNVFVQLEVEGDPIPKFEFYKVPKTTKKLIRSRRIVFCETERFTNI